MVPPPRPRARPLGAILLAIVLASAARAAPADLSANIGVVSDYRFRGVSLSNRKPALQGGVDLGLAGGWYAGTWGSTIARYGGSRAEVDLYGGRTGHVAGFDYSLGASLYLYPRGRRVNYAEVRAEFSRPVGPATLAVEADYVPEQHNSRTDNIYVGARATLVMPDTPFSLTLRGGYEDGFYARKLDWEAGLAVGDDHLSGSASLTGSHQGGAGDTGRLGRTGLRFALAASF
ncbi:TorF family putative porin [Sphingomonas solaris]|uniref:Outer membrane beta-barrel protein n=1 Tax=Alterirhizorhabdus solaris TaxID=2529389 RepID=A0A558RCQ1_9SPHN|nr:TorF family putative porin [Sphingomonas solaris]TVV77257.1 hypothetical protein FOY91_01610 [Sphingomonas solaris]